MNFVVGYASQIGGCKKKPNTSIAVGELQLSGWKGATNNWKHWQCISKGQTTKFAAQYNMINISSLLGYYSLRDVDKARVHLLLDMPQPFIYPNWTGATANTTTSIPTPQPQTVYQQYQPGNAQQANPAPAQHATSAEELKDLGNLRFKNEEYDSAIDMYTQAIALKANPVFYTNRAAAYMALKRFELALDDCQSAAQLQSLAPTSKTLGRLAKCHLALGDPNAAKEAAQAALECDPSWATKASAELMQQHLAESQHACEKKSWEEAKSSLHKAAALCEGSCPAQWCVWEVEIEMARSNWNEAATVAKNAVQLHPSSANVQAVYAQVELLTNCLWACMLSLRIALRNDPYHERARELLPRMEGIIQAKQAGDRHFATGQSVDASAEYTKALDLLGCKEEEGYGGPLRLALLTTRSATYTQMLRLAMCCLAQGDAEGALKHVHAALVLDPLDSALLNTKSAAERMQDNIRLSRKAWANKEWSVAKDTLAWAAAGCAGNRPLQWWYWKVEAEMATGSWDDAVDTAQKAVGLHPTSSSAFAILGLTLMLSDKLAVCPQPLQSALRLDPNDSLAVSTSRRAQDIERVNEEGNRAFRWGRYSEAVDKYTETLNIIGNDGQEGGGGYLRAASLANRAAAFLQMEKHTQALVDVLASLELRPRSITELRTHGRIRMAQGYYDEAIAIYSRAREAALLISQSKDYYGILNVPNGSTELEIRKAYRRCSLHYHPDKGGNPEHFKLVSEAYTKLSESW
ncbi:hypothetical protein FRB94_001967 [Tulasnella sp. JGI-2019a]|nr:hypothetical protein FRB94_001967 [Tulasnella sp. JGI-2019a]